MYRNAATIAAALFVLHVAEAVPQCSTFAEQGASPVTDEPSCERACATAYGFQSSEYSLWDVQSKCVCRDMDGRFADQVDSSNRRVMCQDTLTTTSKRASHALRTAASVAALATLMLAMNRA